MSDDTFAAQLRQELQAQDNLMTAEPLYVVYQKQRIYGLDPEHAQHFVWLSPDKGDGRSETTEDSPGAEYVGCLDVDRFVTACLTRKAALEFIQGNSHRLNGPYVFVESLHRNDEMIAVRKHLMGVAT